MTDNSAAGLPSLSSSLRAFAPSRETTFFFQSRKEKGFFTRSREAAKKVYGRCAAELF